MPSSEEVKGMQEILDKLNAAATAEPQSQTEDRTVVEHRPAGNVSDDAKEMYDILYKLQEATTRATKKVLQETEARPELSTATFKDNSITVAVKYNIQLEERNVIPGVKKTFYNIVDQNNEILYEDIALFESAMGIVKGLMFNKLDVDKIVTLDERYSSYLTEAAMYKHKARTIKESYRQDVAVAKQGSAISKMAQIKKQIKTLL